MPPVTYPLVDASDVAALKSRILASGLTVPELVQNGLGLGCYVPGHRHARWRERGAHSPRAPEGLGRQ